MKLSLWDKGIRALALVLALGIGAAGCVQPDPPSVAISKKKASLVFGVTVTEPVKPITEALPDLQEALPPLDDTELVAEEIDLTPPPVVKKKEECPKAEITAAPEKIAEFNVAPGVTPPLGSYKWIRSGFIRQGAVQSPFIGTERRVLADYAKISDAVFTYKSRYRTPDLQQVVEDVYRVETAGTSVGTTDGVASPVTGPRAGENDRGLLLVQRTVFDKNNKQVSQFAPASPLLVMPLPASSGEEWQSVSVDSKSGQTIIHRGKVTTTQRVDACGDLFDGWGVESTQTWVTAAGSSDVKYDYVVAPQYGAIILKEHFVQTVGTITADLTFQIGQLKPTTGTA